MPKDLALFQAMYTKMDWQTERQKVLAENIANADTPNYVPRDLKAPDFRELLQGSSSRIPFGGTGGSYRLTLETTQSGHQGGNADGRADKRHIAQQDVYETAPSGNAVILEEQLLKANELAVDHRMITSLYQKNVNLLRTAIRGSGQ